jgi:monoterpene epsilon-lactone hydrolase
MPSPEAEKIIAEMRAEPVGPLRSLEEERTGWEAHVKGARPAEGTLVSGVSLSGVPCERVERADSDGLVVLYAHGGGFNAGSPRTHRLFAAFLSRATGGQVIVPEYALAPEEPFPAGLDDIVAVYAALAEDGVDPGDIVLAGDSAGGGLALSAALKLRELGAPMPRALVLLSPWADLTLAGESHRANRKHPNPTEEDLRRSADWYAPGDRHHDPLVSPLFADLRGLPPMLVQVGGHEVLLDDAVELVRRAKAAGVDTQLSIAPELWHGYQLYDCPEARDAIEEIAAFVHAAVAAEVA